MAPLQPQPSLPQPEDRGPVIVPIARPGEHPACDAPYKAAFFDIDGTLLSFKTHLMPLSTKRAIFALHQRGVLAFVSSGRPSYQLPTCISKGFDGYVTLSGQLCYDEGGIFHSNPIPRESVRAIVEQVEAGAFEVLVLQDDRSYASHLTERVVRTGHFAGLTYDEGDIRQALDHDVYQFCAFVDPQDDHLLTDAVPGIKTTRWCDRFCDVVPATGGKPVGVRKTLERHGLTLADAVAFGDGENDISMLECVACGVAMGNAVDKTKACADVVTTGVDDDGIWNACVKLGLI